MTQYGAVIDIGTNTAHLLIAELETGKILSILVKNRHYTYLGESGLEFISSKAIDRLFLALQEFHLQIIKYNVPHVRVIATDALRSAKNGNDIQNRITREFSWIPEIISGIDEAKFIARGVRQSFDHIPTSYLIMDIGGGSVEFILVMDSNEVHIESLPLGISRLHNSFHLSDPPLKNEVETIRIHIKETVDKIFQKCKTVNGPFSLVGSAGTFETFLSNEVMNNTEIRSLRIDLNEIILRYNQVTTLPSAQWGQLTWLPKARQSYIIAALILIHTTVELFEPAEIIVSKFALKEGVIISAQ